MLFKNEVVSNKILNNKFNLIKFKSKNSKFAFEIGQFVILKIKDKVFRCYSLVSAPDELPFWEIFVDITPGGIGTTYLKSLEIGQVVEVVRTGGQFSLNKRLENYIFGATGCGIAPFLPMMKKLIKGSAGDIYVFWGLRNESDIVLTDLFESYSKINKKFHFEIVLSKPGSGWRGKKGHITDEILRKTRKLSSKNTGVYLSGSNKFVTEINKLLLKQKFSPNRIYWEACY